MEEMRIQGKTNSGIFYSFPISRCGFWKIVRWCHNMDLPVGDTFRILKQRFLQD